MNVGQPRWSSTTPQRVALAAARRRIVCTKLLPVRAAHPRRAHDRARRRRRARARRPASSGRRPTAGSVASHSVYGSVGVAVEDVVGRHVARGARRRAGRASATWRVPRALTAKARSGSRSHASTSVHAAGVDDGVGLHADDRLQHGVAVGDVERRVVAGRPPRRRRTRRRARARAAPPAPVIRTAHQHAGAPRASSTTGATAAQRLPPRAVVGVPADRVGERRRRTRSAAPSPARRGSSTQSSR